MYIQITCTFIILKFTQLFHADAASTCSMIAKSAKEPHIHSSFETDQKFCHTKTKCEIVKNAYLPYLTI